MASCKDCIHYEVCGSLGMEVYRWGRKPTLQIFLDKYKAEHCTRFKTRSRFVKLPCKLGDEIFYTTMGKIHQAVVDRIELYDEGVVIITPDGYCPDSSICYHTQEEAERALKERE